MTLEINRIVELWVESESGGEKYRTRVEGVAEPTVTVAAPLDNGTVVALRKGQVVSLEYWDTDPKRQGRYHARFCVERRHTQQGIPMLELTQLDMWSRIQERDHVRVDLSMQARYVLYEGDSAQPSRPCMITSLSGGGLLFVADELLSLDARILISLPLDSSIVGVSGRVVRVQPYEAGTGYGVAFVEVDDTTRQTIIQYVFRRQLESRRKGLV